MNETLTQKVKRLDYKRSQLQVAEEIIQITSNFYLENAKKKGREGLVVLARHLATYIIKDICDRLSFKDIGLLFGGKNHATIMYSCDKMDWLINNDKEVSSDYSYIMNEIKVKVDLTNTSRDLEYKKIKHINLIEKKMLDLQNKDFYDLVDVINNHLKNYEWKA